MSNPIFVKTPQPDTEERLVLVPPGTCTDYVDKPGLVRLVTTDARDATPDDLARGGYVPVERAEKAEWSARVARMALANEHQDREGVRIRKDLGTQDAPCPCDTDPEQGMGMHSPPCPLHEAVRELRRKTSWKDAALTLDGELKNALVRAEKAEGLLIQRETELRLAREDGAAVERQMREARSAADASFVRANQAEKRAEKAERERDEARRVALDVVGSVGDEGIVDTVRRLAARAMVLARTLEEREKALAALSRANLESEKERNTLRAEVARLTAPGEGSEGEPTDWLGMWNGFTLDQVEDSLYGRIKRVWRAGVAHERARQQPTKDRATKCVVVRTMRKAAEHFGRGDGTFNAAGFSNALYEILGMRGGLDGHIVRAILDGRADCEVLSGGSHFRIVERAEKDRATDEELVEVYQRAVAARVRQERCLVAQAVGMGWYIYLCPQKNEPSKWDIETGRVIAGRSDGGAILHGVTATEVPTTLARLLGEVSRG